MSSQGFSFPPPPPPPPRQQQQQQHNPAAYPPQYGQSQYGQRGGRGAGGHPRGRGRGHGNRGGGRGGHFTGASQAYSNASSPSVGYAPVNYAGFAAQPYSTTPTPGIPTPQYANPTSSGFPSPQPFSQPTPAPYQHQPTSYDAVYSNPSTAQTTPAYPPAMQPYQHASSPPQPSIMGPPMRWGFEQPGPTGAFPGAQGGNSWGGPLPFNNHAHGNHVPMGDKPMKHPNKRDHAAAFNKPRIPAPPPVPSFGNPLPSKPPPPSDAMRKPKKKRKHNQLGLTPKTEDHESSEEEDDVDEEAKLTSGGNGAAAASSLRFSYRGRTATLQTPEEIAAWIEERKKRFPTQAKIEEKKKATDEAKKARDEAFKQKREARNKDNKDTKWPQRPDQRDASGNPADTAAKAAPKADKLRQKLIREQKRVAKAEADAERARLKLEKLQKSSSTGELDGPDSSYLNTIDDSEWTSSSGSEVSLDSEASDVEVDGDDGDDSSDGSAPEEMTSRREGPERVLPPPRDNVKKRVCRHFARNGRCLRGDNCSFLHEAPERKAKPKPVPQKGKTGLLQKLLNRQEEDDNHWVMEAIMSLGENGVLDEPTAVQSHDDRQEPPTVDPGSQATVDDAPRSRAV